MALQGIISAAKEEIREQFPTSSYPEDLIYEIADSSVPIYHRYLKRTFVIVHTDSVQSVQPMMLLMTW